MASNTAAIWKGSGWRGYDMAEWTVDMLGEPIVCMSDCDRVAFVRYALSCGYRISLTPTDTVI